MTDSSSVHTLPSRTAFILAFATALLIAGCAGQKPGVAEDVQQDAQESSSEAAAAPKKAPAEPAVPTLPLTKEVLYKLLVAEIGAQRGQFDLALSNYLGLARNISDPQLAKRAANIAVYAKRNPEALEAARLWASGAPTDLEARQVLAAMLIRNNKADEALPHLEYVLNAEPDKASDHFKLIVSFLGREEDSVAALRVMEKLMEKRQSDPDALFAHAILALRANDVAKARTIMEKLLTITPVNNNIALAYLGILQKQGDLQTALNWLKSELDKNTLGFDMRMVYAKALADSKRYDQALLEFEALAKEQPDNTDVKFALAILYLQGSQFEKAREYLTQLVDNDAYHSEAAFYLGQIADTGKDYETALRWYASIVDGERHFDAQLMTALTLARLHKVEAARDKLRSLKAANAEEVGKKVRVEAEILTEAGHYDEAMAIYDRALGDKFDAEILYARAMLAEKMGRVDIVERDLRRILKDEPDNVQALNALGYTLADKTMRHQEAFELLKRALELRPNDFYVLDSMGWVLYRLGRLPEAANHLRRAQQLRDDPEVAAHLGEVLWMMGDKAAAKQVWDNGLEVAPGDPRLLDVIKRLAQ
jgi:tetratricopeptide (TPR) repeat protein